MQTVHVWCTGQFYCNILYIVKNGTEGLLGVQCPYIRNVCLQWGRCVIFTFLRDFFFLGGEGLISGLLCCFWDENAGRLRVFDSEFTKSTMMTSNKSRGCINLALPHQYLWSWTTIVFFQARLGHNAVRGEEKMQFASLQTGNMNTA